MFLKISRNQKPYLKQPNCFHDYIQVYVYVYDSEVK